MVPPGIDHRSSGRSACRGGRTCSLSVGRANPLKNVGLLLEPTTARARPALHLFGVEPEIGRRQGATYHYAPSDEEVARLYATATAFVLTSVHEGYGLPILEAWACGCPVADHRRRRQHGLLPGRRQLPHRSQDDPASLARTLDGLLADRELQEHLRPGGLETVAQYTWDRAIDLLDEFYRLIARERSRRL